MLLVVHAITYLAPVLKSCAQAEQVLSVDQDTWDFYTPEYKREVLKDFYRDAEICLILGTTEQERERLLEVFPLPIANQDIWFVETNSGRNLPIRFTSPF